MKTRTGTWMLGLALFAITQGLRAQDASTLVPVLRPSPGVHHEQETLQPVGKWRTTLADGREVELDTSWFHYLGDMQERLVFEAGQELQSASPQDLARFKLDPEQALQLAVANLRRTHGAPDVRPWSGGLMQVQGAAADLNSSYVLDRGFWRELEARHPAGLVVAVPRRGGLVYAPADDAEALVQLRFSAAALYASADRSRLSPALYLFKGGRWSVFQPPAP